MIRLVVIGICVELLAADLDNESVANEKVNANPAGDPDLRSSDHAEVGKPDAGKRFSPSFGTFIGRPDHRVQSRGQAGPKSGEIERRDSAAAILVKCRVQNRYCLIEWQASDALTHATLARDHKLLGWRELVKIAMDDNVRIG